MCKKCGESWDAFLAAKAKYHKADREYRKQCQEICDDKEYKPSGEVVVLTDIDKIMHKHEFHEASKKEGLWFKQLEGFNKATVYIDLRNSKSGTTFGFNDGKDIDTALLKKHTGKAHRELKALAAKNTKGQTGLDLS